MWCDTWGFTINTDKTVEILFSNNPTALDNMDKLMINNKPLKIEKSVKFLGLIFDQKLTWNDHIKYIENKCNKRLNLMRSVAGNSWGG